GRRRLEAQGRVGRDAREVPDDAGRAGRGARAVSRGEAPNLATRWARSRAESWAAAGLEHVCPGSGSRAAPLVEAFGRISG
ncbi:hypothetical protein DF186_22195, partial [Enterococcus hirae]